MKYENELIYRSTGEVPIQIYIYTYIYIGLFLLLCMPRLASAFGGSRKEKGDIIRITESSEARTELM